MFFQNWTMAISYLKSIRNSAGLWDTQPMRMGIQPATLKESTNNVLFYDRILSVLSFKVSSRMSHPNVSGSNVLYIRLFPVWQRALLFYTIGDYHCWCRLPKLFIITTFTVNLVQKCINISQSMYYQISPYLLPVSLQKIAHLAFSLMHVLF